MLLKPVALPYVLLFRTFGLNLMDMICDSSGYQIIA